MMERIALSKEFEKPNKILVTYDLVFQLVSEAEYKKL